MKLAGFAAIAALAAATPAFAVVQLDQNAIVTVPADQTLGTSTSVSSGDNGWALGQIFTAGKTGTLAQIDLQALAAGPASTYTLTLFDGNVTDAGATPVASLTFTGTQSAAAFAAGGVTSVDVSSLNFGVTAGSLYSYSLTAAQSPATGTSSRLSFVIGTYDADQNFTGNGYTGGRSYRELFTNGVGSWVTDGNYATVRGFATYVDVAPVPEPGEWAMMGAGLALVGGLAKRRRKA